MANTKISALTELATTPDNADELAIVDGGSGGTTKRITVSNLMGAVPATSVEGTAILSTGESGGTKFLREDGDNSCSWQTVPAAPVTSVAGRTGVVTLSNTDISGLGSLATQNSVVVTDENLRGTANPHIGAFPNQSFLVVDNPSKSVMLGSDADGTLNVINSLGKFAIPVGLSVSEDSAEPDIEITTTSGTYSLITGDSDALGANGLPIRQGFNTPDIGANPAPLLISGGTIS
jgi:hypothetical protein